ncbi:MAG: hypothetical protein GX621_04580, partial [Pirellulaceae bacterium]|nr:hypothetical protein [Pirellulaceae bacterium]
MASPELGSRYCLRCGKPVGEEPSARQQPESAPGSAGYRQAATGRTNARLLRPSGYDGWETDEQLAHVARLLGESNDSESDEGEPDGGDEPRDGAARYPSRKRHRFDAAHLSPNGHHSGSRSPRTATAGSSLARR